MSSFVRFKNTLRKTAEELHHGQIDFAVAAVYRRIDQDRLTRRTAMQIASPKIPMQARWRLCITDEIWQPQHKTLQPLAETRRSETAPFSQPELPEQAFFAVELGPGRPWCVGLWEPTDEVVVIEAELGRTRPVQLGQGMPEVFVEAGLGTTGFEILEH
jgi:hypothetical protein